MSAAESKPVAELTEQERRIVEYLRGLNGRTASYREIADAMGWASVRAVGYHVEKLAAKGIVEHGQHRGLRLIGAHVPEPLLRVITGGRSYPILGEVAAGEPIAGGDGPHEELNFEKKLRGEDVFMLKVRGDSMVDMHIADGDLIAVQRGSCFEEGVVVVRIEGGFTLKEVRRDRRTGAVVLRPHNKKYATREVQPYEDAEVIGALLGVFRFPK